VLANKRAGNVPSIPRTETLQCPIAVHTECARGFYAGGWGDYADAVAGNIGAVLFAGCVAGVEGESKDVETGMYPETATTDRHG
jgi:hypothetical protein